MAEKLKIAGTTYLKFKKGNVTTKGEEGEKHVKARIIDFGDSKGQTAFEVQMDSVTGTISRVQIVAEKFGEELLLTIPNAIGKVFISKGVYEEREMELAVLSVGTESVGYFETLGGRLPAMDLDKEVTIKPYDFVPKGQEYSIKGVSVTQGGKKIDDYFREEDGVNDKGQVKYKAANGMPERDPDDSFGESKKDERRFIKKFIKKEIAEKEVEAVEEKGGMVEEDMPF